MGAGPLRLLDGGLVDRLAAAGRPARVMMVETSSTLWPTEIGAAFDLARQIATRVRNALSQGAFPIVLSGNCLPAALGAISGANHVSRVIWFDAHGDFNTPDTSITGFLDGMALATISGHCWRGLTATIDGFSNAAEATVTLVGARDLDPLEAKALSASQITRVSAHELTGAFLPPDSGSAYVHIDLDVLDPSEGPMNGYAAPGGITRRQLHEAIRRCRSVRVASVTAFDPAVDLSGSSLEAALSVCVDLALLR
jgi:arginase